MKDTEDKSDITIFCSGSEVWVALEVSDLLSDFKVRVVNLSCWELFDEQLEEYKTTVIGNSDALKISIEAGVTTGWQKYTGLNGLNFGIDTFGESAPGAQVADKFGLVPSKIASEIKNHINKK